MRTTPTGSRVAVVGVTDGDTISVRTGARVEPLRLIGINSPETGECFAVEATTRLTQLVQGRDVQLATDLSDRDQYGRLLRYVYVGDVLVNEVMVREGYAHAHRFRPDTAMASRFELSQTAARSEGLGFWAPGACGGDPPPPRTVQVGVIHYDAAGDDSQNKNDEWVEFHNSGDAALDMTGWGVKDSSATHRFAFPTGFVLAPGADVRVHTGCGTATQSALFWCVQQSAVWNNDGDTVFLLDPSGNIVTSERYVVAPQ